MTHGLPGRTDQSDSVVEGRRRPRTALVGAGVTVNAVTPGAVGTNIRVGSTDEQEAKLAADIPVGRTTSTEEAATVITFLSSQDASYLAGTTVISTAAATSTDRRRRSTAQSGSYG